MTDDLPPWLSTKEAALKVALWLYRQPDRRLHHMRVLCELAELSPCLRDGLRKLSAVAASVSPSPNSADALAEQADFP
jgi:hypothetical protein